jgi:type IV pilus assembly protein PilP
MQQSLSLLLFAVACAKQPETAPTSTPAPIKAAPAQSAKKTSINEDAFTYSSVGKRDPFRSYLEVLKERGAQESGRKREDTEKFELDQYKLTGMITGSSQPLALVEDPEGKGHVLKIGSRLGKNGGRLTQITSREIVVMEEYRDPKGNLVHMPISIKLPKVDIGGDNAQN